MTTPTEKPTGRKPDFVAYNVRDTKDGKGYFNRIGVAFVHRDNLGLDILIDCAPLDGRISLRKYTEKVEATQEEATTQEAE